MSYSGGGFDDNAGGYTGSQQTPQKARRDYDSQTLIPVTVKMIQDAISAPGGDGTAGDIVLSDERPIHMIKLVGAVRNCQENSTNTVLDVEDGTGLFSVKIWGGNGEEGGNPDPSGVQQMRAQAFQDNQYVRIIGQVREFDGTRTVMANDIRVLETADELSYHFCEVAYSYEKHLKRKANQGQAFGGAAMGYGIGNVASGGPPPQANGNIITPGENLGGGNTINDAIIKVLQTASGDDVGVHVDRIKEVVAGQGFSDRDVEQAVSELSNEGHIYSTIDENHYHYAS